MLKSYHGVIISLAVLFTVILNPLLRIGSAYQFVPYQSMEKQINNNSNDGNSSSIGNKVVILNFYDDDKSQFTNAKPILDKYGFKVTFFIVCNWAGSDNNSRMTWQDIAQLHREGHDIESHSMTHKRLNKLSTSALEYEVGQSKLCIYYHIGAMPTVFSPPHTI